MVPSLFLTSSHHSFPLPIFPRLLIESPSIALFTKLFFRCFASISSFYGERAETHLGACTPTPTYTYMHMQASYLACTCTVLRQRLLPYNTRTHTRRRACTLPSCTRLALCLRTCMYVVEQLATQTPTLPLWLSLYPPLNSVFQASNIVISLGSCRSPPWHAMSLCTRLFLSSPRALFTLVHRLFSGNDTKIHRKNLPTGWKCCSVKCTILLSD